MSVRSGLRSHVVLLGLGMALTSRLDLLTNQQDVTHEVSSCPVSSVCVCDMTVSDFKLGVLLLACGGLLQFLMSYHFPFLYKNNPVPPSDRADCTTDSADCFSALSCLFVFIWLLYFGDLQSLFWQCNTYCYISGCAAFM